MSRRNRGPEPSPTRHGLIPLSLMVCFGLYYAADVPFEAVAVVALLFSTLYVVAPFWGRASMTSFDRDAIRLLSLGRRGDLLGRYRRSVGMLFFAPPVMTAERRGMVYAETGSPRRAREAFAEALEGYPKKKAVPLSVRLGFAHASYAVGEDEEAIEAYSELGEEAGDLPKVKRNLAHALLRSGGSVKEASEVIDEAERRASPSLLEELRLLRALGHARAGRRGKAKRLLREVEGDRSELERLREEVEAELR